MGRSGVETSDMGDNKIPFFFLLQIYILTRKRKSYQPADVTKGSVLAGNVESGIVEIVRIMSVGIRWWC